MGRRPHTDKPGARLENPGQEAFVPAAACTCKLPGVMDQFIHLRIKRFFGKRYTLCRQKDPDEVFIEALSHKVVSLLCQILKGFRLTAAHEKGRSEA